MSQSVKTVILWLVLIVMMVAIYSLAGGDGSGSPVGSAPSDGLANLPWALGVAILIVGGLFAFGRWSRRGHPDNDRGLELQARGRYAEALAAFEAARSKRDLDVYRLNAASARLMLFQVEDALSAIATLQQKRGLHPNYKAAAEQLGALGRAIAGRHTDADRTLVASKEHPYYLLIRAIHAVRRNAFVQADRILATGEIRQLGGKERALADVLTAWCALELRAERRPIDRTALFGEAAPDGLFEVWPELEAFLDRHEDQRSDGGA